MKSSQKKGLESIVSSKVEFDCSLKQYTSFSIGGPAAALIELESTLELQPLLAFIDGEKIVWRVIGRGTNIVVRDEGFPGVVIILGKGFKKVSGSDTLGNGKRRVAVGAGHNLSKLSVICAERGLSGLEFSCGIPGTVGGGVIMNAGAWGGDMSRVVSEVTVVTAAGKDVVTGERLNFSYRSWPGFKKYMGRGIVTEVALILDSAEPSEVQNRCKEFLAKRRKQQPVTLPNAGSIFKNPPGDSAGRLIDLSGLKGTKIGGAAISEQHGNFIVNTGGATAGEVMELINLMKEKIKSDHNVELNPEVHFI